MIALKSSKALVYKIEIKTEFDSKSSAEALAYILNLDHKRIEAQVVDVTPCEARWEQHLQGEIDRIGKEIKDFGTPHCPPSKGISSEVGHFTGLQLRKVLFEDALRFGREGHP